MMGNSKFSFFKYRDSRGFTPRHCSECFVLQNGDECSTDKVSVKMSHFARDGAGFSLVELLVAVSVLSIFFLAAISAFLGIGRGILISKTRTIATTLAQEKIESLKSISYPRLLVTTQNDLTNYGYDYAYYPPETIVVSEISFTRRVVIHKVREKIDGKLGEVSPTSTDTGLKKIKVTVLWTERGEGKSLSLSNLRENPDRKATDSTFSGTVYKATGGTIDGARIYVEENPNWETYSDGTYTLWVSSGTWHLKASKPGYWEQTSAAITIGKGETKTQDFTLTEKTKGNAYGYVYLNNHLVISEVSADTGQGNGLEYIELYNPTTWTWTLNSSTLKLKRIDLNNNVHEILPSWIDNTLPPNRYFLFLGSINGSTVTPNGVLANATYYTTIATNDLGVAIQDGYGLSIDTGIWSSDLGVGQCQERFSYPSGIEIGYGNAYDTDSNADFSLHSVLNPENTSTYEEPISGKPAAGATITCNDGLSSLTIASTTGYWYLTNIATGSWIITISSGSFYRGVTNVTIRTDLSTSVPNGSTQPSWILTNWPGLILSSTTTDGFISGKVNTGNGILGDTLWVSAGISYCSVDGTTKRYWLQLSSGSYLVIVNPTGEYYNSNYTSSTTATVEVIPGQISVIPEIFLSPAGVVWGKVTSNGLDPLPDIIIAAYDRNGYQVATKISDSLGEYSFSQLPTSRNTYKIKPELDAGESFSTVSYSTNPVPVDVVQGSTVFVPTFTITSAYGKLTGTVKENNQLIKTGVLIMVTTTTISSEPPIIDHALRQSSLQGGLYYYATVSASDGSYELPVRGSAVSYNVYAWYTKLDGTVTTTRKSDTTNVSAGQTVTVNFIWP